LVGVGYRASNQGQKLDLALGYSHNIVLKLLWSTLETISEKGKTHCKVNIVWQTTLGQVAAKSEVFVSLSRTKEKVLNL
jgi:large subunit ribosomal protein L6